MAETNGNDSPVDEMGIALAALGWTLDDQDRALRLLSLTGLTPDQLKSGVENPTILAAVLNFLESYEPDLIACANALAMTPEALVNIRRNLEN